MTVAVPELWEPGGACWAVKGPGWRWEAARAGFACRARRPRPGEDDAVLRAGDYLRRCRRGPDGRRRAAERHPLIAAAETLNRDADACERLKILALGDCPQAEIATRLKIDVAVVECWETLFFSARHSREATGWVFAHIIRPEQQTGNGALAARLKLACSGGPVAARALLDADAGIPLAEGERLFQHKLKLHLRFEEAIDAPLDSDRSKREFLKFHADLMLAQQRLRLAEQKLEEQSAEALRKHEGARLRLQASAEREERRAAERARNAERREKQRVAEELRVLKRRRLLEEREAAAAGAAASPLAQLVWSATARPEPRRDKQ